MGHVLQVRLRVPPPGPLQALLLEVGLFERNFQCTESPVGLQHLAKLLT